MQGLMAEDLLNLTNAGGLKTQGEQSIFQIALPNSNDLNKYKWSLVKQNDRYDPILFQRFHLVYDMPIFFFIELLAFSPVKMSS